MTSSSERVRSTWSRDDITSCECKEKPFRHVHCPCFGCQGRATDRKTELRNWKETHEFAVENSSYQSDVDSDIFHDILLEQDTYDKLCGEENGTLRDPDSALVEPLDSSEQEDADDIDVEKNPLKEIVVKAVPDALRIKHQSGASVRTFEDVLEYGKKLFFLSLNEDVDVEVLTTL